MTAKSQIVLVSCPPEQAEQMARGLVEARMAACVNVIPGMASTYRWKEAVEHADEALLIIKTSAARFEELRQWVLAHHPYELPEVIAVDIAAGHAPYLDWIERCVSPPA